MALSVTHSTVVATPDDGTSDVGTDEWNAAHTLAGVASAAQGGTGVSALGDLTKVDDTNVTLTLGGTPTGALITSASLTLGWSGTLAASRGGTGISALGTGVATALGINVGSAGAFVTFNGALGTPSSGTLSSCTGFPAASLSGLGSGVATFLATPSSANLISAVTDETGTGALVFANTPTLVTPVLGAATGTSVVLSGKLEAASIELGHASENTLSASGGVLSIEGTVLIKGGTHTIWIPAGAMIAAATSGAATASLDSGNQDINYKVFDFDASADEYVHFTVAMPKGWDEGTVTYQVFWSSTATDTDGVAWALQGVAISDNEAINTAFGTEVVVTDDAQSAAGEAYVTVVSSAVTIGGSPAEGDVVFFRLFRDVSDANDDMTEDARLLGVKLFYTVSAANDA